MRQDDRDFPKRAYTGPGVIVGDARADLLSTGTCDAAWSLCYGRPPSNVRVITQQRPF